MKLVLTIHETTAAAAMAALEGAPDAADLIELRADAIPPCERLDLAALRARTTRPLIFTRRTTGGHSGRVDAAELQAALDAGFDLVDVEYGEQFDPAAIEPFRSRAILSFHDFAAMPDLEELILRMAGVGCAMTKIAVTPLSFVENLRLLAALSRSSGQVEQLTMIGMGSEGLYSRILAPFFGSALAFTAAGPQQLVAPGQLTLEGALAIYGSGKRLSVPETIFAVVGNPAAHSLSPSIHNRRFRDLREPAAYSIAETSRFEDVASSMVRNERFAPDGISVTAPYKEDAFAFALAMGAEVAPNAMEAGAANTLVVTGGRLHADNTDVDAFEAVLRGSGARTAAVIGAGGTARSALVALRRLGISAVFFARNGAKAAGVSQQFGEIPVRSLESLASFEGEVVINTAPGRADLDVSPELFERARVWVQLDYSGGTANADLARSAGALVIDGAAFLNLQAARQSAIFLSAIRANREQATTNDVRGDSQ